MTDQIIESARRAPAAPLRPFVAWYSGYRQAGLPPGTHRGLPSPHLTVILTLDEPLTIARHADPRQPPSRYGALVGGLHTSPVLITHEGRQSGIQLALHPLGARALLGLPAGALAGVDLPADAVVGSLGELLRERIGDAGGWVERFDALDEELCAHLRRARWTEPAPEVAHAWHALLRSGGTCAVEALADEVGWSGRHLRQRLRLETGLSPKPAARVIRFDRARRLLAARVASGGPADLADLAAACGYYDQSHLDREFCELAGCAPSHWVAEELRNIQAQSACPALGSGA